MFGVYADEINAQNINGLNIAKYLNKSIFEPHMFYVGKEKPNIKKIFFHKVSIDLKLRNIEKFMFYLNNKFDIYYFPRLGKAEYMFGKILYKSRCIITTIELETLFNNKLKIQFIKNNAFSVISINNLLKKHAEEMHGIKSSVLYLGCDNPRYIRKQHDHLNRIAYVGTMTQRKRPDLVLDLAKRYPNLTFIFIGDGPLRIKLENIVKKQNIKNVVFEGRVSNDKVYKILSTCDLLLITSENEGQPKVSLEAGTIGVPTCYIKTNYRIDHVINKQTGFVVNNIDEMAAVLEGIIKDYKSYDEISKNIICECKKYYWKNLIKSYEDYYKNIYIMWNKNSTT